LLITCVSLEFSFLFCFIYLIFYTGSYSFDNFLNFIDIPSPLLFPVVSLIFFLYSLFESKRAPFDHAEAESELIAGHIIEFSGKSLLLFYFSEYMHLLFIIFLIKIICLGLSEEEDFSAFEFF
jgi:NADH-quinone oxidoreductase subunit H